MTRAIIEAYKDRIIIAAPTQAEVREEIQNIFAGVTAAYCDFTTPIKDAGGQYVSTGRVRLHENGEL